MKVDFYLETRKCLDLGITRKVYTGNLLQRIFRIGPYREEKVFDPKGIFIRSDSLEISVLVYTKEWEWIDTLYYGNKNVEDSHIRLIHLVSEEAYRVEIDLKYLSMSYKYLVFVAHYKKKKNESEQVRLSTEVRYDSGKEPLSVFRDLTDNEWQIVGYLENDGKSSRFIETWESWSKLETGTLLDIEKQFKRCKDEKY